MNQPPVNVARDSGEKSARGGDDLFSLHANGPASTNLRFRCMGVGAVGSSWQRKCSQHMERPPSVLIRYKCIAET